MTQAATKPASTKKPRGKQSAEQTPAPSVAVLGLESSNTGEVDEGQLLALLETLGDSPVALAPITSEADLIDLLGQADTAPVVIIEAPVTGGNMLDDLKALDAEVVVIEAAATNFDPSEIPEPPKDEKKKAAPRQVFDTRSAKIQHKLGDKAKEYLILDVKDAELSAADLEVMQTELLSLLDSEKFPKKVGEKATMLFGYLRNGGKLNEIMRRAFTLLIKDGELSGGDKGNLISNLLTKPYSVGTARSQATQMFALFPTLKICLPRAGGKMAINPDSTIIAKMKSELGL